MSLTRRKTSMWWTTTVTRGKNEKKALHQVLSKGTVFTSFDLFLAELPFPVIWTKYLGPAIWSALVNSTNGGKHKTRQCLTQKYRPEKSADISTDRFSREMTTEKWAQKFHTDDASLPRSGLCFWLVVPRRKFDSTNQEHYPDLDHNTSSVLIAFVFFYHSSHHLHF